MLHISSFEASAVYAKSSRWQEFIHSELKQRAVSSHIMSFNTMKKQAHSVKDAPD